MQSRKKFGLALASAVVVPIALAETDIWSKTINNDSNGTWNIQPDKPKAKFFAVEPAGTVRGDHAFRTPDGLTPHWL